MIWINKGTKVHIQNKIKYNSTPKCLLWLFLDRGSEGIYFSSCFLQQIELGKKKIFNPGESFKLKSIQRNKNI